jgi:hypothetical protein
MRIRALVAAVLVIVVAASGWAAGGVGKITYLDGTVKLTRNGKVLSEADLYDGFVIQNCDLFKTGSNGMVKIQTYASTGVDALITIQKNTSFYLELSELKNQQKAGMELMSGSVSLKVAKLSGKSGLEVKTDSAVMGVRGTEFDVDTSVEGDLLVSCTEGKVECTDDEGGTAFAEPDKVVEKSAAQKFKISPVKVSGLKAFRANWNTGKVEAFKANALKALIQMEKRYTELKKKFKAAYAALRREATIIKKWQDEDASDAPINNMTAMKEKKRLNRALFEMRKVLFMFERIYFRLLEIEDYVNQGYGRGNLRAGYSSAQFFADFNRERDELFNMVAEVKFVIKMFARRNNGAATFDSFEDDDESGAFDDEED